MIDSVSHSKEGSGRLELREEVGKVVDSIDIRDLDLEVLDTFANKEVSASDVLDTLVVLGVVGQIPSGRVVSRQVDGLVGTYAQLLEKTAKMQRLLGCL